MKLDLLALVCALGVTFGLTMGSLAGSVADTDSDGIPDAYDNCITIPNGPLWGTCSRNEDIDGDGYGDACDADWNNDGAPGFDDLTLFLANIGNANAPPGMDLNCDGAPGFDDCTWLINHIGEGMGTGDATSGLPCAAANLPGSCPPY